MFNVRLRMAVFTAGQPRRYAVCRFDGSDHADSMAGQYRTYRGPAIEPPAVLAMLEVPGLPEGSPAVAMWDTGKHLLCVWVRVQVRVRVWRGIGLGGGSVKEPPRVCEICSGGADVYGGAVDEGLNNWGL
jgi:hypothetical protein